MEHDASFVWKLQQKLTEYIRNNFPNIKFIEYFLDGYAGQYKNFKNFPNLTLHQLDFNLAASWSFFATSHGKSSCDGIGVVVKRKLSHVSLTRETTNPILTSSSAYECCQQEFNSIIFFHVDKSDLVCARQFLYDRYQKGSTVVGTCSFHHFYPLAEKVVAYKRLSDETSAGSHCFYVASPSYTLADLPAMSYVACKYDEQWWVEVVLEADRASNDIKITFMHPHGPSDSFFWPSKDDVCWMQPSPVIFKLNPPTTSNGRSYKIDTEEFDNIGILLI